MVLGTRDDNPPHPPPRYPGQVNFSLCGRKIKKAVYMNWGMRQVVLPW